MDIRWWHKSKNFGVLLSFLAMLIVLGCGLLTRGYGRISISRARTVVAGYSGPQEFKEGLAIVKKDGSYDQYGFIDRSGQIVIEADFTYVDSFREGLATVQKRIPQSRRYRCGYIDTKGQVVIPLQFNDAREFSENLAAVKINDKYGYIDKAGKMIISPQFDDAFPFSEGRAKVVLKGRCGFIDTAGNIVVEPKFYKAGSFSEGLAFLCNAGHCGYIDKAGNIIIEQKFDDAKSFAEGLAPVKVGQKWRYISKDGVILAGDDFDEAWPFSEGLGVVGVVRTNFYDRRFGGYSGTRMAYGFIDKNGIYVIQPKFFSAEPFSDGLSRVEIPAGDWFGEMQHYIFIDRNERQVSKRLEYAKPFKDGLALVKDKDQNFGFIGTDGRFAIKFQSKDSFFYSDERISILENIQYGYIESSGEFLIAPQYYQARSFSNGLAYVEDRGQRQFINKEGEVLIKLPGTMIPQNFLEGLAAVSVWDPKSDDRKSLFGYMDTSGNFVIKPQFYSAQPFSEGKAAVKFDDRLSGNNWGYIDRSGQTAIPMQFSGGGPFHRGIAFVQYIKYRSDELGGGGEIHSKYVDENGKVRIDLDGAGFHSYTFMSSMDIESGYPGYLRTQDRTGESSFVEPLLPATGTTSPNKRGFVDSSGKFVIRPQYDDVKPFSEGLAAVKINGRWGFVDTAGSLVVKPAYDDVQPFSQQRALVVKDGKYGYIDPSGQVVIEPQFFEEAYPFSNGLALIKMNGRYGYIDQTGDFFIEPQFYDADSFKEGAALVGVVLLEEQIDSMNDQQKGKCKTVYSRKFYEGTNTLKMEIPFVNGKAHGKKREFYPSGKVKVEVDYVDGKQTGMKRFYYENESLDLECPMVDDLEEGECRFYNSDGSLKEKVFYKQGKPVK